MESCLTKFNLDRCADFIKRTPFFALVRLVFHRTRQQTFQCLLCDDFGQREGYFIALYVLPDTFRFEVA